MKTTIPITVAIAVGFAIVSCQQDSAGWQPPQASFQQFRTEVFPVLLRDCAFSTCHGSQDRFFRIWGPGRTRLDPMSREFDVLTANEAADTFQLAKSMVDAANPSSSLLLRKPLAVEAGGAAHRGSDKFGRNIYPTVNAAGYLVIAHWVFSVTSGGSP